MKTDTATLEIVEEPETGYWFVMRRWDGGSEERIGPCQSREKAEEEVRDIEALAERLNRTIPESPPVYYRRGPKPKGNTERLMLYLSPAEKARLEAYCAREGCTQAEAARRALKRLK